MENGALLKVFLDRLSIHSLNWGTAYIFHNLGMAAKRRGGGEGAIGKRGEGKDLAAKGR